MNLRRRLADSRSIAADVGRMARGFVFGTDPTWCFLLNDRAYIDSRGRVFACCHAFPYPFGTIYRSTLGDIWKGRALRTARALSARRRLYCCYMCNILTAAQKREPLAFEAPYPTRLWILFSEFCNISCIMCAQDHRSRIALDMEVLRRAIDWGRVTEIEIQGGEVLALKGAKEFYRWVTAEAGVKANMITNGCLVDDEWADRLARGANWIGISVNAATAETHGRVNRRSDFDRVIRNIERLVAAKRACGSRVQIVYKFTIVPENASEAPAAIAVAERIGCDIVEYGFSRGGAQRLRDDAELRGRLRADFAAALSAHGGIPVKREELKFLGLIAE